jgi:hypothetical protein
MRTQKKYSLPKPLVDFSNIYTGFADKMIHIDEEKNGRLNLVLIEKSSKSSKSSKKSKKAKTYKLSKTSKTAKTYKSI